MPPTDSETAYAAQRMSGQAWMHQVEAEVVLLQLEEPSSLLEATYRRGAVLDTSQRYHVNIATQHRAL